MKFSLWKIRSFFRHRKYWTNPEKGSGIDCIYRRVELDLGLIVWESMRTPWQRRCGTTRVKFPRRRAVQCPWIHVKRLQAKANVSPFLSQTRSADQPGNRKYELNDTRISLIEASVNTNTQVYPYVQPYIQPRMCVYTHEGRGGGRYTCLPRVPV